MKLIFLGTPKFAADVLRAISTSKHQVLAVVTQPDRPNRRGNRVEPPEAKRTAIELGYPVLQYEKLRSEGVSDLRALNADVWVTAAYGQILSDESLAAAPFGVVNVHASILPKYRGSSPVQWALMMGENTVGVTIMKTAKRVDSGEILMHAQVLLKGDENTEEVLSLLAPIGAKALLDTLDLLQRGEVVPETQDEAQSTHFPMLKKEDGKIDFNRSALEIKNKIRAMTPWPSAYCTTQSGTLKLLRAEVVADGSSGLRTDEENTETQIAKNGQIVAMDTKNGILVQVGHDKLLVTELQPEGGKKMQATAYVTGRKVALGEVFK